MNDAYGARRLVLVRHGLPDYRGGKRGDECPGPPLSHTGRLQAAQAADSLRAARFAPEALHASPLMRTRQTAEIIGESLALSPRVDADLSEWHRTMRLYQVNDRAARWLRHWLAGRERCAIVVSHASPLLSIMRTALYLPHFGWARVSTCDRFEVSMASVFELLIEPDRVTARCLFHPRPRVLEVRKRRLVETYARPTLLCGENACVQRPNFGPLIGYRNGLCD